MTTAKNGAFAVLGVKEAVKWLIDSKEECNQKLQFQAELKGLLHPTTNEQFWKCDGERLTFFLKLRTRSASLLLNGAILLGLGELVARSRADERLIYHRLQSIFQSSYPEFKRLKLLKSALDLAAVHQKRPTKVFDQITVGSSLSILNWDTVGEAKHWINQHHTIGFSNAYGIWFLTRMILHSAPHRTRWLSEEADRRGLLNIVVNTVSTECSVSLEASRSALQTGVPFYIGFGLSMLYGTDGFKGWSSSQADNILSKNGVPLYGRMKASAFMLKEAVHSWYRQKERPDDNRRRQTLLRIEPKYALGGADYASQEIVRLKEEEKELASRYEEAEKQLQDALECAAMLNKEPDRYWSLFEPALVDTPEVYYRFAIAHADTEPRTEALKQSINRFDMIVGVKNPEQKFDANLDYHKNTSELAFWAAKSQFELSDRDGQDVGHVAVRRITRLEKKVRCFTTEPFASSRYGERFQNALHRWAVALEFAANIALLDKKSHLKSFERILQAVLNCFCKSLIPHCGKRVYWTVSAVCCLRLCRPGMQTIWVNGSMMKHYLISSEHC
ncbi:hypothetical protein [Cohaesibacter gelatinilyticus]|uniref:Uncharacterized protein n=1 Tax=Cohaesibacter gelatinilyticus TaxID=372072 RepID=A0A285NDR9_9HYPH|nr:hypothetical protein [Cohaesibacter gelatinilyticus]SNZ07448.1 hypothetical protein SAMN06265368_0971 [Cohaesibacter gelatinilyticus]